ncbi:MAG: class I SAM-dependent methyltransferase [Gemmatimonadota bacterium]
MTRKIKRTRAFELTLEIKDDAFVRPPTDAQRNWLLNRTLREAADDLEALDAVARRFVPGGTRSLPSDLRSADLTDAQIMEDWQLPLMRAMADIAGRTRGDILEVGFGRGISAELIQAWAPRSHTLIECNPAIVECFHVWREGKPDRDIRMVEGLWQDVLDGLGRFDAIFFHTYALDEDEAIDLLSSSVTFAEHFFAPAAAHLVEGGVFTYLTNEIDSLSRAHQRRLFEHFTSFRVHVVPLQMPPDVQDAWWAPSMAVIEVHR